MDEPEDEDEEANLRKLSYLYIAIS